MSTIKIPPIHKVIVTQCALISGLGIIVWLIFGWVSAYSLLAGGLISTLPNAYFAWKAFRYRGARSVPKIVRQIYSGEAVKLGMIGAGFALTFYFITPLNVAALFSGFILAHITGVLAFVRIAKPGRNNP